MAKKKEVASKKELVIEKPKVEAAPVIPVSSEPTLKKAIVTKDVLMKLQDEARLVGYDPKTGEATYKEA